MSRSWNFDVYKTKNREFSDNQQKLKNLIFCPKVKQMYIAALSRHSMAPHLVPGKKGHSVTWTDYKFEVLLPDFSESNQEEVIFTCKCCIVVYLYTKESDWHFTWKYLVLTISNLVSWFIHMICSSSMNKRYIWTLRHFNMQQFYQIKEFVVPNISNVWQCQAAPSSNWRLFIWSASQSEVRD